MSEIKESEVFENLPDPITRHVEIKDESNNTWVRGAFADLTRGCIFRVYDDPTCDPNQEWTARSDPYPNGDGVTCIDAAQNVHG